jgi:hypothetical protein
VGTLHNTIIAIIIETRWVGRLARIGGNVLVGPHEEKNHLDHLGIRGGYIIQKYNIQLWVILFSSRAVVYAVLNSWTSYNADNFVTK